MELNDLVVGKTYLWDAQYGNGSPDLLNLYQFTLLEAGQGSWSPTKPDEWRPKENGYVGGRLFGYSGSLQQYRATVELSQLVMPWNTFLGGKYTAMKYPGYKTQRDKIKATGYSLLSLYRDDLAVGGTGWVEPADLYPGTHVDKYGMYTNNVGDRTFMDFPPTSYWEEARAKAKLAQEQYAAMQGYSMKLVQATAALIKKQPKDRRTLYKVQMETYPTPEGYDGKPAADGSVLVHMGMSTFSALLDMVGLADGPDAEMEV